MAAHIDPRDMVDARWLAQLMRYGLLQASFISPQGQRDLRDLTRYRTTVVQERSREANRVQGVLERANIKLASVATDIMWASGRAILWALIEGRTDPATMAELAKGRLRSKRPRLEQALTGLMRDHHRRLLALQLAHIDFLDEQIDTLNADITRSVLALGPDEPPAPAIEGPRADGNGGASNMSIGLLSSARAVSVLDIIPSVDQRGAELLVAEWGTDMARFGTGARLSA